MAKLLPSTFQREAPPAEPRVLGVGEDDADEVLAALSSDTARNLLATLHDDPATPSELADRLDQSLQNTQYHLEKLVDADLVAVCGTQYSEKGREMQVYAPADEPLVLFAGPDDDTGGIREALRGLLGGVGVLALASLLVQYLVGEGLFAPAANRDGGVGVQSADQVPTTAEQALGLPPGLLFFLGGTFVLLLVTLLLYWGD